MRTLVSHPTGNSNVRAVLTALAEKHMLTRFNTTIAIETTSSFLRILPGNLRQEFLRRQYPVDRKLIHTHMMRELMRLALPKLGLKSFTKTEKSWASVTSVYKDLDSATASDLSGLQKQQGLDCVYAYEDGALNTFAEAQKLGLKRVYELPIAYWETVRTLLQDEAERLPAWSVTLLGGIQDSEEKLERKTNELKMADVVILPSSFVKNSLPDFARNKKIILVPFGSPKTDPNPVKERSAADHPLRVLFVGSMGQRKGLGDLFQAMKLLKTTHIQLIVLGSMLAPIEFYKTEFPDFIYEPSRSHDKVLELMRSCDVFCLPSLAEGRALVMQEAMSQGLPIVVTANTGGEDLVIEGKTGFLIPIRSPETIAEKLAWFAENRERIPEMGAHAKVHAASYSWNSYGNIIAEGIS